MGPFLVLSLLLKMIHGHVQEASFSLGVHLRGLVIQVPTQNDFFSYE